MGKVKRVPLRKCVGCGLLKEKNELLRVLKTPEGVIVPDLTGRANGRGAYLCRNSECFRKALKTKALQRSLASAIDEETLDRLEKEITAVEK